MTFTICSPAGQTSLPVRRPQTLITRLRQTLSSVERTTGLTGTCAPPVELGIAAIDAALAGGLAGGALHEFAAEREASAPAASAFALALAARATGRARHRALLWIAEDLSLCENGIPYGPGLDALGIAPEGLITVAAPRARDVLWTMEEALRCRALAAVIGEVRAGRIDQVATRRLSLAAAAGDTIGVLLRITPDDAPHAFATRWTIGAAPSSVSAAAGSSCGIGPPRLSVRLVRNRRGQLGAWIVEWNSVEQRFELATRSEPVAGAAFDRPHRAALA
jgi:protein ImuA